MIMKKHVLTALLLISSLMASAQKNTPQTYIEKFKPDAIRIMHETGVPASIVLGVAMHESGCGNSALAQHLNNQFGVKGSGHIVYYRHNKKVRTAYKRYDSVFDSFQDFARIMTERREFSGLSSSLTHFDYTGWAHGIQKHGMKILKTSKTWRRTIKKRSKFPLSAILLTCNIYLYRVFELF
jgi:flagellum-specific peptidoglycan hydrolase FlgJ